MTTSPSARTNRAEEERILALDGLAWAVLGSGMLAMVLLATASLALVALWFAAFFVMRRAGLRLRRSHATLLAAGAIPLGLAFYAATANAPAGWCAWLMALQLVLVFQEERESSANKIYLVAFLQIMVFATFTLELHFILIHLVFLVAWIALSMRRLLPEAEQISSRRWLLRRAVRVAAVTLAALVPIWMLFPRASFTVFPGRNGPTLTGFGEDVELGDILRILPNDDPVMRVVSSRAALWRGVTLNAYTGRGWRSTLRGSTDHRRREEAETIWLPGQDEGALAEPGPRGSRLHLLPPPDDAEDLLVQEIMLEPLSNRFVFGAADAVGIDIPQTRIRRRVDGSLQRGDLETVKKFFYRVRSRLRRDDPTELRGADGAYKDYYRRHYLPLPALAPRMAELARRIVDEAGARTHYEKAEAVDRHLRESGLYTYSLEPPRAGAMDPVEHFLFEGRRGHCELFASAMAILLRLEDVPARVVNGFRSGTFNEFGGYFTVTQADAHSWVEIHVPDHGWVEFDPTPGDGRERIAGGLVAFLGLAESPVWLRLKAWFDALDLQWQRKVISYSAESQRGVWQFVEDGLTRLHLAWLSARRSTVLALGLAALAGLGLVLLLRRLARPGGPLHGLVRRIAALWAQLVELLRRIGAGLPRWSFRRRQAPPTLYAAFCELLSRRRGLIRPPGATPREFLNDLARREPELAELALDLLRLHEGRHYAGRAEEPEKERNFAERMRRQLSRT